MQRGLGERLGHPWRAVNSREPTATAKTHGGSDVGQDESSGSETIEADPTRFPEPHSDRAAHVYGEEDAMTEKRIENTNPRATTENTADTRNPEWKSYAPSGHGQTDEQIRADVHAVLSETQIGQPSSLEVSVLDGIVTLSGEVNDASEWRRIREKIRSVPSVKDVRDQSKSARA